ncbi:RUN and FYVE domain-containing protein 4 isoform X2 [Ambystoma mexicanum]|uniref:RUN and FYVE domain-containing protein 4 isoform X2 n=1 Tax=Ambystoma mexicanum TaxID=8296 RepID=UPI0037E70768
MQPQRQGRDPPHFLLSLAERLESPGSRSRFPLEKTWRPALCSDSCDGPELNKIMAGDAELVRVIKNLKDIIGELNTNYRERNLPVTDGSPELCRLCVQLEFLLQLDQKEKKSFFGTRRDYWDFFCYRFSNIKGGHKGIDFVTSVPELKTSIGRGRSFIRYCLAQQQLAESLQLAFMELSITREWYYARNPFLNQSFSSTIIAHLYELDSHTFNLALRRADLDKAWPMTPGSLWQLSNHTDLKEEKAPVFQAEPPETNDRFEETQWLSAQKMSTSAGSGEAGLPEYMSVAKPKEYKEYSNKLATMDPSWDVHQIRQLGPTDNFQHVSSLLESLVASEKREIELQRFHSELQGKFEKLKGEHQSLLTAMQEMTAEQRAKEQSNLEETQRLQEELERDKKMHTEQMAERERQVRELQDTNTFLNETLEELDALVNDLRHKMSEKENVNQLQKESEAELKASMAESHEEELIKLDKEHKQKLAQYKASQQELIDELAQMKKTLESKEMEVNEIISEHHQSTRESVALARSLEELAETCKVLESERRKHLVEGAAQEFKYQQLNSHCQTLQEKLNNSHQKTEEQEELLSSLRAEVNRMRVSENPSDKANCDSENEDSLKFTGEQQRLEEELRSVQAQREKTERKLEVSLMEKADLEKEKLTLSETVLSHKQDLCSAKLDIEDLNKQITSFHEQITSLKTTLDTKGNTLRCKEKDIAILQTTLEDTTTKLKAALSEKSLIEAQLVKIVGEHAKLAEEKTKMQIQEAENVVKLEEALNELKCRFASLEEKMLMKEEEAAKTDEVIKMAHQSISEEKELLSQRLQSTIGLLEERSAEATRLRTELEKLQSCAGQERSDICAKVRNLQTQCEDLAQQRKDMESKNLALSEEVVQFRYHVKKLELEKMQATDLHGKSRAELEQTNKEKSFLLSENTPLKNKIAGVTSEWGKHREDGQKEDNDQLSELLSLQKENKLLVDNLRRVELLEKENQTLQEKLQAAESQRMQMDDSLKPGGGGDLVLGAMNGPKHLEKSLKEDLEMVTRELETKAKMLSDKENEVKRLTEQVLRIQQDQESLKIALEKEKEEAKEKEESYKEKLAEQKEMVQSMKSRVLQLLHEKDALWKKTEGISVEQKGKSVPDPSACKTCKKDFKLLSKKYQCRTCSDTICPACVVDAGKKQRYCSPCYQQKKSSLVT